MAEPLRARVRRILHALDEGVGVLQAWSCVLSELAVASGAISVCVAIDLPEGHIRLPDSAQVDGDPFVAPFGDRAVPSATLTVDVPLDVVGACHAVLQVRIPSGGPAFDGLDALTKIELEYALTAYLLYQRQQDTLAFLEAEADCLPFGRYVVDEELGVHYVSPRGQRLADTQQPFALDNRRLTVRSQKDRTALRNAIQACSRDTRSVVNCVVGRFNSDWPCALRVRPLGASSHLRVRTAWYEIIVLDRSRSSFYLDDALIQDAALTPAERRVLSEVLEGRSAAEIAERLGITAGTAKLHIMRAMKKLGVNRQTRLMREVLGSMVCRLPGADEVISSPIRPEGPDVDDDGRNLTFDVCATKPTAIPIGIADNVYRQK